MPAGLQTACFNRLHTHAWWPGRGSNPLRRVLHTRALPVSYTGHDLDFLVDPAGVEPAVGLPRPLLRRLRLPIPPRTH